MARTVTPTLAPGTIAGMVSINGEAKVAAQLRITQERIDVSTRGPKPDPNWSFTDAAGHFHARSDGELPTLIRRVEHRQCDGSCLGVCEGEGFDVTHYHCRICDVEIEPGVIPGPHYETMPGMVSWDLVVETYVNGHTEVSVVFTSEWGDYFGTATPYEAQLESGPGGRMRGRTMLYGASPLGRKAP